MTRLSNLTGKVHNKNCIKLMESMRAKSVQMIFADPPFNLNKKYNSYKDNLEFSEYIKWTEDWLMECCRVLKDGGSLFIYNIPRLLVYTAPLIYDKLEFRHWIAWNSNGQPLGKTLQPAHYGILFFTKNKKAKFYDVRAPHAKCRKCKSYLKDYGGKEHLRHSFGFQISDVWSDIHRVRHNCRRIENHPCQLPVHLLERLVLMSTDENDIVLDPFCGSGTMAVAAKQMGRRYIGCDVDFEYCKIANNKLKETKVLKEPSGIFVSRHLGKIVSMRHKDIKS